MSFVASQIGAACCPLQFSARALSRLHFSSPTSLKLARQIHSAFRRLRPDLQPHEIAQSSHFPCPLNPNQIQLAEPKARLDDFQRLVHDINDVLGPWNGIDSASVDLTAIKWLMTRYRSDENNWARYAFADPLQAYTRNLVDNGNGKTNLLILVWTPGQASPVHDHADSHCVMKILKGRLTETLYAQPTLHSSSLSYCHRESPQPFQNVTSSRYKSTDAETLEVTKESTYQVQDVAYMHDRLGLHKICNPSPNEFAVSLHLYTPPNAAKYGCHIFDETTCERSHRPQCRCYSEYGVKT